MRPVHVAVGVLRRPGKVLLARRAADVHQGGLWEFPGGKVEVGESVQSALQRELHEELAIEVGHCEPLIQIRHDYPDKSVLLDVWEVRDYAGEPRGNEGQPLAWVEQELLCPGSDCPYPLPAANAAIIKALRLPDSMLITGDCDDEGDLLARLQAALDTGIRLVQLRPDQLVDRLSREALEDLLNEAANLCAASGAKPVINSKVDVDVKAAGIHLSSAALMASTERPSFELVGASCHNERELEQAAVLDLDYVLLSPVLATASHPSARPMGWQGFRKLVEQVNIPVYALGGLAAADIPTARQHGAQGIAAIRAFWNSKPRA